MPNVASMMNIDTLHRSMKAYWDEMAAFENAVYERAKAATADFAALATESMAHAAALTTEWRKMTIEATRKLTETFKVA
jgi:hypothetical protein